MHRSYRPILPAQNKLLARRWEDRYYEDHRRKGTDLSTSLASSERGFVRNCGCRRTRSDCYKIRQECGREAAIVFEARPTVDTRPPQTYMHLHLKLKKLQLEEDRLYTIERDNRILLGKMSNIMKAKGSVDNRNSYEYRSLNRDKRVRDLIRVSDENQQILKRITTRKPQYDHAEWEKDWETNQQYMDNISSYPKDWWKKGDNYSDGSPRSSRRGGGGGGKTNRSSRSYDDSRDSSPRQDKDKKKKKRREESETDRSSSEDEEERKQARRREDKKKGKKWEEDDKTPRKEKYVEPRKEESKNKGK